jgi:hypothetical protein
MLTKAEVSPTKERGGSHKDVPLFAQRFDAARLELKGNPFSVAEHIATLINAQGAAAVSASSAGPIIYRTASSGGGRQFVWLDRSGKEIGKAVDPSDASSLSISRDTRRVALWQMINNSRRLVTRSRTERAVSLCVLLLNCTGIIAKRKQEDTRDAKMTILVIGK